MKIFNIKFNHETRRLYFVINFLLLLIMICCSSCKKYLDQKPDSSLVIPETLQDCQALLSNVNTISAGDPVQGEIATDDYVLTFPVWNSLTAAEKDPYIWQPNANIYFAWSLPYQNVLVANQVLAVLDKVKPSASQQTQWNELKGAALFLRSFSFFNLAQIFAQPYQSNTASKDLGIPLRLTPSISDVSDRGTLEQTYQRIIADLQEASLLLPAKAPIAIVNKTTAGPVKCAAYALLARVYLSMADYPNAYVNADAALKQYSVLMDYNPLPRNNRFPIPNYNPEVIYDSFGTGFVPISNGRVNINLYNSYTTNDLRKLVCFQTLPDGYRYSGNYARGSVFTGLSTNEQYLIRAECSARAGNTLNAMTDLNNLLRTRWLTDPVTKQSTYSDMSASSAENALDIILAERKKELPFRGLRWIDLRRLNKESKYATTLTRSLNGQNYTLPPNDLRYTFLIPNEVQKFANLPQNPR